MGDLSGLNIHKFQLENRVDTWKSKNPPFTLVWGSLKPIIGFQIADASKIISEIFFGDTIFWSSTDDPAPSGHFS